MPIKKLPPGKIYLVWKFVPIEGKPASSCDTIVRKVKTLKEVEALLAKGFDGFRIARDHPWSYKPQV